MRTINVLVSPTGYPLCLTYHGHNENNRGGIIFPQQFRKVIKGSQILSQGAVVYTHYFAQTQLHLFLLQNIFPFTVQFRAISTYKIYYVYIYRIYQGLCELKDQCIIKSGPGERITGHIAFHAYRMTNTDQSENLIYNYIYIMCLQYAKLTASLQPKKQYNKHFQCLCMGSYFQI